MYLVLKVDLITYDEKMKIKHDTGKIKIFMFTDSENPVLINSKWKIGVINIVCAKLGFALR